MKALISFIFIMTSTYPCFGRDKSKLFTDADVKKIEKDLTQSVEAAKLNQDDLYYLYTLAARELMQYGYYGKALEYYSRGIDTNTQKVDKTEAYYNILFIHFYQNKDKASSSRSLESLKKYLKSKNLEKNYASELSAWQDIISGKLSQKANKSNGFFRVAYNQELMKSLIKQKQLLKAMHLLPNDLSDSNINAQLESDILRTAIYGRGQNLLCSKMLKRFPTSISYQMSICRFLKSDKSISLEQVKQRVNKSSPDKSYLFSALDVVK